MKPLYENTAGSSRRLLLSFEWKVKKAIDKISDLMYNNSCVTNEGRSNIILVET